MFFHFYFLGDESTVVVVETQTRQTDRQTDREVGTRVCLLWALWINSPRCCLPHVSFDSDLHDIQNLTDKPVVVSGFFDDPLSLFSDI